MESEQQVNEVMGPSEALKARVPLNLPDVISGGKHQFLHKRANTLMIISLVAMEILQQFTT